MVIIYVILAFLLGTYAGFRMTNLFGSGDGFHSYWVILCAYVARKTVSWGGRRAYYYNKKDWLKESRSDY